MNKVETAVRIIHKPTGLDVRSTNERSQLANREKAMQILSAKLEQLHDEVAQILEVLLRRRALRSALAPKPADRLGSIAALRMALGWLLFGKGARHLTAEMLYEEATLAKIKEELAAARWLG